MRQGRADRVTMEVLDRFARGAGSGLLNPRHHVTVELRHRLHDDHLGTDFPDLAYFDDLVGTEHDGRVVSRSPSQLGPAVGGLGRLPGEDRLDLITVPVDAFEDDRRTVVAAGDPTVVQQQPIHVVSGLGALSDLIEFLFGGLGRLRVERRIAGEPFDEVTSVRQQAFRCPQRERGEPRSVGLLELRPGWVDLPREVAQPDVVVAEDVEQGLNGVGHLATRHVLLDDDVYLERQQIIKIFRLFRIASPSSYSPAPRPRRAWATSTRARRLPGSTVRLFSDLLGMERGSSALASRSSEMIVVTSPSATFTTVTIEFFNGLTVLNDAVVVESPSVVIGISTSPTPVTTLTSRRSVRIFFAFSEEAVDARIRRLGDAVLDASTGVFDISTLPVPRPVPHRDEARSLNLNASPSSTVARSTRRRGVASGPCVAGDAAIGEVHVEAVGRARGRGVGRWLRRAGRRHAVLG